MLYHDHYPNQILKTYAKVFGSIVIVGVTILNIQFLAHLPHILAPSWSKTRHHDGGRHDESMANRDRLDSRVEEA